MHADTQGNCSCVILRRLVPNKALHAHSLASYDTRKGDASMRPLKDNLEDIRCIHTSDVMLFPTDAHNYWSRY